VHSGERDAACAEHRFANVKSGEPHPILAKEIADGPYPSAIL